MDNGFAEGYAVGQGSTNNNGMFGESWLWIIVIFALLGFGNGFGGYGGGGVGQNHVLATDFATIERKIDTVNSGLCDGFYAMNTGMLNGFANITNAITTGGYETRSAIADLGYRMQDCCCQTQRAIDSVNYNMAQGNCALQNTIHSTARDIIDSQRDGTNAILGFLTNEKISSLQAQNAQLTAQLSQAAQTQTLINTLRPTAVPAYITCSPYQSAYGCNPCGCGC
jgi:hypothetical protein